MSTSKSKQLIGEALAEADETAPYLGSPRPDKPQRPSGFPRPGGPPPAPEGKFSHRERMAFQNIMIADLLHLLNRDPFYTELAQAIMQGKDPDEGQIRHFLDEGPKFYDLLGPAEKALLDKLMA